MNSAAPYIVTGPAYWASALVNGDRSGLGAEECAQLDAWLKREGRPNIVDVARDDDGNGQDPRFTWHFRLYAPECDCDGGEVLDYLAVTP